MEDDDLYDEAYEEGFIEGYESFVPGDVETDCPYQVNYDDEGESDGRSEGLYNGWYAAFYYNLNPNLYKYQQETYERCCTKRGHKMKNKFLDKDGKFDEMAFRQHCITIAQQHAPRGAIAGANGPEPIGETLARAQMIERYLKDGEITFPQQNGAAAA